jgi:hypothetical protein
MSSRTVAIVRPPWRDMLDREREEAEKTAATRDAVSPMKTLWVRMKDSGQELEMIEAKAREFIFFGHAVEIETPKTPPVSPLAATETPEGERANHDLRHDPLWHDAQEVCRKVGLPKDAAIVVYRGLKNREQIEQLEERLFSMFTSRITAIERRITALEQTKEKK